MKVLITGGLGGIGRYVSRTLLDSGIDVTILAHKKAKYAKWFPKDCIRWGDITDPKTFQDLLTDLNAVIHLAFLVNPHADDPRAYEINVGGTQTLIRELEQNNRNCRFIFSSSTAVFGPTLTPPIAPNHVVNPNDNYSRHKVKCEEIIKHSKLKEWIILRIALVPYIEVNMSTNLLVAMFRFPHDLRIEFVHPKDVALACKTALETNHKNEIYLIGGGSSCQMIYYDLLTQFFTAFHLPFPPRKKFSSKKLYGDWYDTRRSQKILQYQNHNFDDYINDVLKGLGMKKHFFRLPINSLYMKWLYRRL